MKFREVDHRVHDALLTVDRKRGASGWHLMRTLTLPGPILYGAIDRLEDGGYIEARWQGEDWPGGSGFNDEGMAAPSGQARQRLYRSTSSARQTLAARIQSQRDP